MRLRTYVMAIDWQPKDSERERWQREAEFFDAKEYSEGEFPAKTMQRYKELRKPWLKAEFPLHVLGDVEGKRVLDLGCGNGSTAIFLGMRGANVLGVDLSPTAIQIATERARLYRMSDQVRFKCMPLELFVQSGEEPYDIICGFAILHHLLPVLDGFLEQLKQLARPDTRFLFVEPVSLFKWLREFRLMLPIAVHATPDERPLEPSDLAIIERHLPGMKARYFGVLTRILNRLLVENYEEQTAWKRGIYDFAAHCDNFMLNTLGQHWLGSSVVLYSHPRR